MGRFSYLDGQKVKKQKKKAGSGKGTLEPLEPLEVVYIRKELLRSVWRQHKAAGGDSVSELVEELLSEWLGRQGQLDSFSGKK